MINRFIPFIIFVIFYNTSAYSQSKNAQADKPKLVVGIVIDQMRYEYINRFWGKYGENGFKKLVNSGFNCKNTHYNYVPTFTGPGHASVYTGTTPAIHGIIGNNWYNKDLNKMIYCTEDLEASATGKARMSPDNMLTTTITDELRIFSNFRSKVIGIALKDRGAILPAGHAANAAYWLDKNNGTWISSTYYMNEAPAWVNQFNSKKIAQKYLSQKWNTLLPIEQYVESAPDNNKYETPFVEKGPVVFPYNLEELMKTMGPALITSTPFGNDFTKDFAIETIKAENLGKGEQTDFITISFSSPDYVGHQFGPQSVEIEDTYLRLDNTLAELIAFLENHLGKDNCLLFLTADHGGANNPAFMEDNKITAGFFESGPMLAGVKTFLNNAYGTGDWISNYSNEQFFLNKKLIEEKKLNLCEMQDKMVEFCLQTKGVANAYSAYAMHNDSFDEKPASLVQKGHSQKRSGDVILILEPGWMEYGHTGTTHGAAYSYDTHVPLLWYGWKVKHGNSSENVYITDIAPTISTLIGIPFPNGCTGKSVETLIR